jgi:hypothetical protein
MNRIYAVLLLVGTVSQALNARIGCMDNSKHLSEPFDTKEYHYVQCNCPCTYHNSRERNLCIMCQHVHMDPRIEVIESQSVAIHEPSAQTHQLLDPSRRSIRHIIERLALQVKTTPHANF